MAACRHATTTPRSHRSRVEPLIDRAIAGCALDEVPVTGHEFRPTLRRQRDDAVAKGQVGRQRVFDGLLDRLDTESVMKEPLTGSPA